MNEEIIREEEDRRACGGSACVMTIILCIVIFFIILAAPIITADELMFGYDKSLFVLPITIQGNPPSHSTAWFKNGEKEELVSGNGTIVSATNITFLSLEPKDNASYTATVYNSIGMSAVTIKLGVYCKQ